MFGQKSKESPMIMMRRSPWMLAVMAIALCFGAGILIGQHFFAA